MKRIAFTALMILCLIHAAVAAGPAIREPKIEVGSRSATITWQTQVPADSVVKIGDRTIAASELTTEHKVVIDQLSPNTNYQIHVTSSDGKLTSHHHNAFTTGAKNNKLAEKFGKEFVESLEAACGSVDEDNLTPEQGKLVKIMEAQNLGLQQDQLEAQLAQIAEIQQQLEAAGKDLNEKGSADKDLPEAAMHEMRILNAHVPQLSAGDIDKVLRIKIDYKLRSLNSAKAGIKAKQDELKGAKDKLLKEISAGK